MSDSNGKINFFQACLILMLMNGLANHVIVNPMILDASGRDAWLSVLCAGTVLMLWFILLTWLMKRSGQQKLQPWLASKTRPAISWLLVLPICVQLYLIGGMTVAHTAIWTLTNYLPNTPKLLLVVAITLICALSAIWGIRILAVTSAILLPFVIALGYFVSTSNLPQKNFELLKPIAEHGWPPIVDGMVYAGGGFVELIVFLVMQHRLSTKISVWKMLVFAAISTYIMIGPVIGAITEFGPVEAAKQMESPYEQWRLVKLGSYVEHVDFFSIYQWLSGAIVRVGLSVFLLVDMLPIRQARARNWLIIAIIFSFVIISMIPSMSTRFICGCTNTIFRYRSWLLCPFSSSGCSFRCLADRPRRKRHERGPFERGAEMVGR
ncbi:endospore germination permease [Cohnella faecalis]|uniref:endospore germination permease n=1 Tax=Cohnella faecalis TaxID=2315694 RepID=UPI001F169032|nr:endospore germination permease [Cohnella faecalis]